MPSLLRVFILNARAGLSDLTDENTGYLATFKFWINRKKFLIYNIWDILTHKKTIPYFSEGEYNEVSCWQPFMGIQPSSFS